MEMCVVCILKSYLKWILWYTIGSKRREITLGKISHLSLSEVLSFAEDTRRKVAIGDDPIVERKLNRPKQLTTVDGLFEDLVKRLKHPQISGRVYKKDIAPTISRLSLTNITPIDVRPIL